MNDTQTGLPRLASTVALEPQGKSGFNKPAPFHDHIFGAVMPPKSDVINHPKHYTNLAGIECIDATEQMNFNIGNAVKYLWRCDLKDTPEENLKKALWYVRREMKRRGIEE